MKTLLVTGGSGFLGGLLIHSLLKAGHTCVSIDLVNSELTHENLTTIKGDIRNLSTLRGLCEKQKFDAIVHVAAILAHAVKDKDFLWTSNVDGTKNIAEVAKEFNIPKVVFTSSNCLWAEAFNINVKEEMPPNPVEIYGKSKWEGEKILNNYKDSFNAVIFRCPTIIDEGRLGLLGILFEFIDEGRKVWVVGSGDNKYQFIYAQDLIDGITKALDYPQSNTFNIGSDEVSSMRDTYAYVIEHAKTGAKVASLPKKLTIFAMKVAHFLKISPLGPYQYKMIAESFVFDTHKIKAELNWTPTCSNKEMLYKAYQYYHQHLDDIKKRNDGVSAHRQSAKMGIIRLLKWIS